MSDMPENPYASPQVDPSPFSSPVVTRKPPEIATQGRRLLNLILDNIFIQILSMGVGFLVGMVYVATKLAGGDEVPMEDDMGLQIASYAIGILTSLGYFVFTEAVFQRTPAKFLTGTMVVAETGARPTFGQIVGRSFARFIPFEAFSFLGGSQPVGWHDSLSGTRVIMKQN